MEPNTPTSLLAIMPNTKDEIASFSQKLITQIEDGEVDSLKIHVQLKAIESVIKNVSESTFYKSSIRETSEKYGAKNFTAFGAKIELSEVGTKYNFDYCGHLEYNDLCAQIKELEEKKKEFEKLLKALPRPTAMVVYGEAIEITPPVKTSTSSIKVSF